MKNKILLVFLSFFMSLCGVVYADNPAPSTSTTNVWRHQNHNRLNLYNLRSVFLADPSSYSMELTAPTLASDTVKFVFPSTNGTSGYPLTTNGSGETSWSLLARDKTATGTAYRILVNNSSGVMSENAAITSGHVVIADTNGQLTGEATLSKSRGGAGADVSSVTFPTSGTIATIAGTQTITNKDIDGGTASNSLRITVPKNTKTNLDGLTRKEGTIVYGTDTTKLYVDNGSALTAVGSGSGTGEINYILNPDAETDVTGWSSYADAAASSPVDGTGGSPNITITRDTTTKLNGTGSFKITKDGSDRQGQGVSYDFIVPEGYRSKNTKISVIYKTSANYVTNDVAAFIYDKDTSYLITPITSGISSSTSSGSFVTTWMLDTTASDDFRLIFHISSKNDSAYDIYFDDVVVGAGQVISGFAGSDPVSYPVVWTAATTNPSIGNGTLTGTWQRIGNEAKIMITMIPGSTTNFGSGAWYFSLPVGLSISDPNLYFVTAGPIIGKGSALVYALIRAMPVNVSAQDANTVRVVAQDASYTYVTSSGQTLSSAIPGAWAVGDRLEFDFTVPIVGWSSGVYLGSGADASINMPLEWTNVPVTFSGGGATYTTGGNPVLLYGSTAPTNIAPTGSKVTYKRNLDSLSLSVRIAFSGAANATGQIHINLPNSLQINWDKMSGAYVRKNPCFLYSGGKQWLGFVRTMPVGTHTFQILRGDYAGVNDSVWTASTTAGDNLPTGAALANGDVIDFEINDIPILNWKASDYLGAMLTGWAGAKAGQSGLVNNDAANTAGTPIKGSTDGVAASTGYVGETLNSTVTSASAVSLTSAGTKKITELTLKDGTWLIIGKASTFRNGATVADANTSVCINNVADSTSNNAFTDTENDDGHSTTYTHITNLVVPFVIRLSGSTATLPDGSTWTLTDKKIYLNAFHGGFSGGPAKAFGSISATRIY